MRNKADVLRGFLTTSLKDFHRRKTLVDVIGDEELNIIRGLTLHKFDNG